MTQLQSSLRPVDLRSIAFKCGAANEPKHDIERADKPPVGYRLVEDGLYQIGPRDLVFVGGRISCWRSARRVGEVGSFRRDSAAMAVAALAA